MATFLFLSPGVWLDVDDILTTQDGTDKYSGRPEILVSMKHAHTSFKFHGDARIALLTYFAQHALVMPQNKS